MQWSYHRSVSTGEPTGEMELVVAVDGSIPADQLTRLGIRPGARLRLVEADGAIRRRTPQPRRLAA